MTKYDKNSTLAIISVLFLGILAFSSLMPSALGLNNGTALLGPNSTASNNTSSTGQGNNISSIGNVTTDVNGSITTLIPGNLPDTRHAPS